MSNRDWKGTAELAGIAAIVASLIFVGLQLRQTEVIARATLYQMRSDASRELVGITLENGELLGSIFQNEASLNPRELLQLRWWALAAFTHYENSHHLYQLGLLSEEQWQSDRRQLSGMVRNPQLRAAWDADKNTYRESYAVEMESIIAEYVGN
jgi:hypothetical protein